MSGNLAVDSNTKIAVSNKLSKFSNYQGFSALFKVLVIPYWKSSEKTFAYFGLILTITLTLLEVAASVVLNNWNRDFFNSMQDANYEKFKFLLLIWVGYAIFNISVGFSNAFFQSYFCFRWRKWLTSSLVKRWLRDKNFYKSLTPEIKIDNPDQRIAQDVSSFTNQLSSFFLGILGSMANLISFSMILWGISPALYIPIGQDTILTIPSYMFWLAILYALTVTYLVFRVGKPLVKLDFIRERVEASFRFSLMRIIERREEVAFIGGEIDENNLLSDKFNDISHNYKEILMRSIYINCVQSIAVSASSVFPFVIAAPTFFAGTITLGVLMQISSAFSQVESSLMIFANGFQSLAALRASSKRLIQFYEQTTSQLLTKRIDDSFPVNTIELNDVIIYKPNQEVLLSIPHISISKGERVFIVGPSGIGKTTLLRVLSGLWDNYSGSIIVPKNMEFLPQKPYFPIATLKEAVLYGNPIKNIKKEEIIRLFSKINLGHLSNELETFGDWNLKLSLGEQQRVSIARVILKAPSWLIMDEPTSSLDGLNLKNSIEALFLELKQTSIITISHQQELSSFFETIVPLNEGSHF